MSKFSFPTLKPKHIALILLGICASFFLLTYAVHLFPRSTFDIYVSQEVQEKREIDLSSSMQVVSWFGDPQVFWICVVGLSLLFWITANRRESLFVLCVFITDVLNVLLKRIIQRPRPTKDIVHVFKELQDPSFPSGHVVHYVVFFGFLLVAMFFVKNFPRSLKIFIGVASLLLILTISVSRIYLGAHWATDVAGGYLVGLVFLSAVVYFYLKTPQI